MGLAACGGGGSGSSGSSTEVGQARAEDGSTAEAGEFKPTQHSDSGGGSAQFKVKGGDNSVQEFGAEAEPQEFEAAAVTLHDFLDARAADDWDAACEYMAKSVVESFEKLASQAKRLKDTSCAGILEKLTNPAAKSALKQEAEKADIGSLRVEGDRSFVIYKGVNDAVLAMPMVSEGGEWRVASLVGTPLD